MKHTFIMTMGEGVGLYDLHGKILADGVEEIKTYLRANQVAVSKDNVRTFPWAATLVYRTF